nr:hypothetical protein JVH1_3123 [Rhodococcus sp. JVH1]
MREPAINNRSRDLDHNRRATVGQHRAPFAPFDVREAW